MGGFMAHSKLHLGVITHLSNPSTGTQHFRVKKMYPNCTLLVHSDNKMHGGLNNTGTQNRKGL